MPQQLLFALDDARVTPHVATFGGASCQIVTIRCFRVSRRRTYSPFAIIILPMGLGILRAAILNARATGPAEEHFSMAVTAVVVVVASVLLQLSWPGRVYVFVLRTLGDDV